MLANYIQEGVDEISEDKLSDLLKLKYHSIKDALQVLGSIEMVKGLFFDFQKHLYAVEVS